MIVHGDAPQVSAASLMRGATRQLEELSRFDEQFRQLLTQLESARITVEDVGQTLRQYADGIDSSPERLAEVEDRLALLDRLKRKYGPSLDEVIAHLRAESIEIDTGPVPRRGALGAIRSVYLRDPDGNLVEIAEYT